MQVADDNHAALKYFLKGFPEFAKNEFYITGESYGGIYVPTLSARIVDDSAFNFKVRINFLQDVCNGLCIARVLAQAQGQFEYLCFTLISIICYL